MRRRLILGGLWGLLLGLGLAIAVGDERQASLEVWVAVVSIYLVWVVARDLLSVAPGAEEPLRWLWRWHRPPAEAAPRPRPLTLIEGLVLSARDNERAMALRLRPRLEPLVDHFLVTRHGIDRTTQPERAAAALGDLAYLVDGGAEPRAVPLEDLDRLLDVVVGAGDDREGPIEPGTGESSTR